MKKSEIIVHCISIAIAVAGGILSLGDKWFDMSSLPAWLVHSWPVVLMLATLVDRIGKLVLAYLQANGIAPLQKAVPIILIPILFLSVSGCANSLPAGSVATGQLDFSKESGVSGQIGISIPLTTQRSIKGLSK